jgi:predicted Zn-dependent protease
MMRREQVQDIAEQVLAASAADQTEVLIFAGDEALTRFANNTIHQNVAETDAGVRVRAVVGKRVGVASGNDTSPDSLKDLAARALEVARNSEPNEEFVSLPAPSADQRESVVQPVQATVDCDPAQRAEAVRTMLDIARANGLQAAGRFATAYTAVCVANSLGIRSYFERSGAGATVLMQAADSSGFAQAESEDVTQINAREIAEVAARKALESAGPRDLEPGAYTVILEPLAVCDMLYMLGIYDLHSLAHQEQRSFTSGHMGEQVCGENISIWDDGWDPRGNRMPFDYEGVTRQRVDIITNGILTALPYDSFTAAREEGAANTGHALPAPNSWGPVPSHLFMNTGEHSLQDMIAATERGVLVTRFHYTNMVHPVRTVLTGMTRDGTFLIENGQIVGGLKNMRFTQSILEALSNVDMIGRDGVLDGHAWAPALRVNGFNFSSATQF